VKIKVLLDEDVQVGLVVALKAKGIEASLYQSNFQLVRHWKDFAI